VGSKFNTFASLTKVALFGAEAGVLSGGGEKGGWLRRVAC